MIDQTTNRSKACQMTGSEGPTTTLRGKGGSWIDEEGGGRHLNVFVHEETRCLSFFIEEEGKARARSPWVELEPAEARGLYEFLTPVYGPPGTLSGLNVELLRQQRDALLKQLQGRRTDVLDGLVHLLDDLLDRLEGETG